MDQRRLDFQPAKLPEASMSGSTRDPQKITENHNKLVGDFLRQIFNPETGAGYCFADALVVIESILVGVVIANKKTGGDDSVLETLMLGVRLRLAEQHLSQTPAEGEA